MRDLGILCVKTHVSVADYVAVGLRSSIYNQDRGILLSRDGGESWHGIGPADPKLDIVDIALHPADPDTLYAATHDGLYKTTDGGKTWAVILAYQKGGRFWQHAPSLAMHPNDPDTLLLSVWSLGIMRTSDGGAHWTRVDQAWNQEEPMSIAAWAPSDGNVVYAERVSPKRNPAGGHIEMFTYRSADAGRTWTQTVTLDGYEQERFDMSLAVDPTDANRVIIGNTDFLLSTDALKSAAPVPLPPHSDHLRTVFAPSNPKVVYNGNDGGVWKSLDGGLRWTRADAGVLTNHVFSFAVAPDSGNIYLSAADYGGIVYYPRYGWRNLDCGDEFQQYYVNPNDPGDVYVGGRLYRVGGKLAPCTRIEPARDEHRQLHLPMAFDPSDANTIYVGMEHVWKSPDRGRHWKKIGLDEAMTKDHHVVTALAIAPRDGRTIYALTDFHPELWVTRDGGTTWTKGWSTAKFAGSDMTPGAMAVSPVDANLVYWGRGSGLYVSRDGGKTGSQVSAFRPEWSVNRIAIDSSRPTRLFVATDDGVLMSEDAGASWSKPGGEFPRGAVTDMALAGRTLYAATDQGVWSMDVTGGAPCRPAVVTPTEPLAVGRGGGSERFDVSVAGGCPWTATTGVDWAQFEMGTVSARLEVKSNPGTERHAALTIADQRIELTQYGGADPIADGAKVTIANGRRCLTAQAKGRLGMTACATKEPQAFQLVRRRNLLYLVTATDTSVCWDVTAQRQAGRTLYLYPCHSEDHQLFRFVPHADGSFAVFTTTGQQCLEARGGHVEQQPCTGGPSQKWTVRLLQ
jgi:photosystem II stability/assembly factor-like uncharacterized protein